jgi:hypothetical protein
MEQTKCSETSAYKIQTPGNYPDKSIQHHTGILKAAHNAILCAVSKEGCCPSQFAG